jgi:sensor c-di-GMP phosphodiesterase-like protein
VALAAATFHANANPVVRLGTRVCVRGEGIARWPGPAGAGGSEGHHRGPSEKC